MKRCFAFVVASLVPNLLLAQQPAEGWPGFATSALSTVYVVDDAGVETSGTLLRLDPDSLVILVQGTERRFEATRVRRIQKRGDSLRNGALIGAIVGVAMGLVSAGISDCPGEDPGGSCPGTRATLFLGATGIYAAMGTGIDALTSGRTTLYEAPSSTGRGSSATISPRRRAAVGLSVSW